MPYSGICDKESAAIIVGKALRAKDTYIVSCEPIPSQVGTMYIVRITEYEPMRNTVG